MAKTAEQYLAEIRAIDEKIKSLNAQKKERVQAVKELAEKEVFELAKQIQKAGKIEEARELLLGQKAVQTTV